MHSFAGNSLQRAGLPRSIVIYIGNTTGADDAIFGSFGLQGITHWSVGGPAAWICCLFTRFLLVSWPVLENVLLMKLLLPDR